MLTCGDIIDALEASYPPSLAEEWDNPGLQVGNRQRTVTTVLTALDLTEAVIDRAEAIGAGLIVTHHPLIFRPVRHVTGDDLTGSRILRLAEAGIACYAMHTNFDVTAMGRLNAATLGLSGGEILSVTGSYDSGEAVGLGCVGNLEKPVRAEEAAAMVREALRLEAVRLYGDPDAVVRRAAVCGGSGRSLIGAALKAGADIYITGDLDHHSALDAVSSGLILIDAGHAGTENVFAGFVRDQLTARFPSLKAEAMPPEKPYSVIM